MNAFESYLHTFFFGYYPYICLVVFLLGSLARFERGQYTWKSESSQMLRTGSLRWGSNLFHVGILFLFAGHFAGLLTPHWAYEAFITPAQKQVLAVTAGGIAGTFCFIGLSLLLHRRITDARVRATSGRTDLALLVLLWIQLTLGLVTLPYSLSHADGTVMLALSDWAQRVVTFRVGGAEGLVAIAWPFKVHLVLGMTLFLLVPFTRLVHVWSGFGSLAYLVRARQVVRTRRLKLAPREPQPQAPAAPRPDREWIPVQQPGPAD
ncbi:MAG TPA: respiratory nitrate reductase subunit gamma [Usitatibacter sp.]|nr:respiratory nitrate reductase subunit gamma [Usitatibacter sp.]